jgi:hypothetical protein
VNIGEKCERKETGGFHTIQFYHVQTMVR